MRRLLIRPRRLPGVGIAREDRHRILVVARPLIGIPRARVAGAVVEEVELGVVAVPAPGGAAAALPLFTLPRFHRSREADFCLRACAVHPPDLLAGVDVVGGDESADTEFTAGDAGDHFVLDHHRRRRDGLALLVVSLLDLPQLLAGFGVERNGVGVQLVEEDLAVGVRHATVDRVAAGDRNHRRVLLGSVLPLDRRALLAQVKGIHDVRKRRVDVHRAADDQRLTFMSSKTPVENDHATFRVLTFSVLISLSEL